VIDGAEPHIIYANEVGKQIIIALETGPEGSTVTFDGLNATYLETVIAGVYAYFKGNASFAGVAIHDYTNYLELDLVNTTVIKNKNKPLRSMYMWEESDAFTSGTTQTDFFDFAYQQKISTIFVEAEDHMYYHEYTEMAAFLNMAKTYKISVELLGGDSNWATADGIADVVTLTKNAVLIYNNLKK
jgi:hypothetical protein